MNHDVSKQDIFVLPKMSFSFTGTNISEFKNFAF